MIKSLGARINKAGSQIRQTFLGIVARGGSKVLQLKGFTDETLQEIELIQHVGFNSYIPDSAKVVVIPLQGKTSKSVVIATTGGAVVVNLAEGETCVYDQFGHQVLLHKDGIKMLGDVEIIGKLKVSKDIKSEKEIFDKTSSMQAIRDAYNPHTHGSSPPPSNQME
ncbi:phage baseplate assembly protein [Acinetobacter junii]|uniref:phage baseplate assembly protein domain-containing protein n=1 Tax=Acinetobacter junii TaxID=40215 RepID=UPI0022EA28BB|nr:phage baseplate assembly protein [Acinetobacter junii]MDA3509400.1 phage baseplate assembly protein [Acinetobacter junii]MDA3533902.1 phage baseplate assembly protein [Acinetobacter junii]